jgi:hypothetical protein
MESHWDEVENPRHDSAGLVPAVRTVYGICLYKKDEFKRQTNATAVLEIGVFRNGRFPYINCSLQN